MDLNAVLRLAPGTLRCWQKIDKGWSGEQKYYIETDAGKFLLRLADRPQQDAFDAIRCAAQTGIRMSRPIACGSCDAGAYLLLTWVDGEDAESVLPTLPRETQYQLGRQAGQILRKLHGIPAPDDAQPWETRFNAKIDRKLAAYAACPLKYDNDKPVLAYLEANRHLLVGRPQSFHHGDYHCGNLVIDGECIGVIDFNRRDHGDPWEEFNRIVWDVAVSPDFAAGRVDGYFDDAVPETFWPLLALYIASNTLSSLPWAIPFGEGEIETMRRQMADVMDWYDEFREVVPRWYRERKK